jgi:hypothetical protein
LFMKKMYQNISLTNEITLFSVIKNMLLQQQSKA